MASATYGFSGKPASVVAMGPSTNYTVPAGQYAFVTACVRGSGAFALAGTTVLAGDSNTWSVLGSSPLQYGSYAGGSMLNTVASPASSTGSAFASATAYGLTGMAASYWVPAGTAISTGTLAYAFVSLFNG